MLTFALMESAPLKLIKDELKHKDVGELKEIIARLARFKKDNKELLSYLLFDADNEAEYIIMLKESIDESFDLVNKEQVYFAKKSIRKILRNVNKCCRYSGKKETKIELLIFFCQKMNELEVSWKSYTALSNLYISQVQKIKKLIPSLHPDLQHDYTQIVESL